MNSNRASPGSRIQEQPLAWGLFQKGYLAWTREGVTPVSSGGRFFEAWTESAIKSGHAPFCIHNIPLYLPTTSFLSQMPITTRLLPHGAYICQVTLLLRNVQELPSSYRINAQLLSLAPIDCPNQLSTAARSFCFQVILYNATSSSNRDYFCT